tara:strand:- start:11 stop:637 length:627 start_codon:yes stop_codon:yes gene_type:complete
MLNVVSKKSLIGKTLDEYGISRQAVSLACGGVAMETISKWCNLDEHGKPRQNISQEHLLQLVHLIKTEANINIDPSDLLEEPDYYINKLRVVGEMTENQNIKIFHRHKKVSVDSKYPPDRSAIEYYANPDKVYYFIFDSIEYDPNTKNFHNIDAIIHLKKGEYVFARNVEIGFDDEVRFTNYLREMYKTKINKIKSYHPITDIKIKVN